MMLRVAIIPIMMLMRVMVMSTSTRKLNATLSTMMLVCTMRAAVMVMRKAKMMAMMTRMLMMVAAFGLRCIACGAA